MLYFLKRNHSVLPNNNELGSWSEILTVIFTFQLPHACGIHCPQVMFNWTLRMLKSSVILNNMSLEIKYLLLKLILRFSFRIFFS